MERHTGTLDQATVSRIVEGARRSDGTRGAPRVAACPNGASREIIFATAPAGVTGGGGLTTRPQAETTRQQAPVLRHGAIGLREVLFQSITYTVPGAAIAASIPACVLHGPGRRRVDGARRDLPDLPVRPQSAAGGRGRPGPTGRAVTHDGHRGSRYRCLSARCPGCPCPPRRSDRRPPGRPGRPPRWPRSRSRRA